jgi:NADP-dependent 3-hydroxy acid dehydrogenase YdfG
MVNTSFFDELGFQPGDKPGEHLIAEDVAEAALLMLNAREGAVIQEINLQPQKKVIKFL